MTRLQRKCLVVSLCFHGVIMGALVVTAAFRSEPVVTGETVLTLISPNILDRAGVGGERGTPPPRARPTPVLPTPATPTPTQPAPRSQPSPTPTLPSTHPLPTETSPSPAPTEPPKSSRRDTPHPTKEETRLANANPSEHASKHIITPDLTPASSTGRSSSRSAASAAPSASATQAEKNRRVQEIESALAALGASYDSKDSASKVVPLPGLDGGESFVNYRTAIFNAYYHAWNTPESSTHKNAVADVKIVVARDGSIVSSDFVSKSGDAAIDRSIQRALDAVKSLPPFPAGATDAERTFIIRFNLEAKESAG
jgi:TonB family protein